MTTASAWITALLLAYPSAAHRVCIQHQRQQIAADAEEAAHRHGIPVAMLMSVAFLESHLGCNPRSGGCWGAPIDRDHRHTAGRAEQTASALALGVRRCGTDERAINHFRWGTCRRTRRAHGYGPESVFRVAERVARYMTVGVGLAHR